MLMMTVSSFFQTISSTTAAQTDSNDLRGRASLVEDATPVYDRLGRELQLASHTLDIIDDLLPMDVQWYKRRASQRHFPIDLCLNAQKEPWFAEKLATHIDATSGGFDEVRLAYVQTISDLHGVKLEDLGSAQVERSILSRQRGLIWLGAKVTA